MANNLENSRVDQGMTYSRIIFERGLEVSPARNSLKIAGDRNTWQSIFDLVRERYHVRPILITDLVPKLGGVGQGERHSVLAVDGQHLLSLRVGQLQLPQGLPEPTYISLLQHAMNLQYTAEAMVHHCRQLALAYVGICDDQVGIRTRFPIDQPASCFQGRSEGYHEFDALIGAARRTYESLRYILWPVFGSAGKDMPRKFETALKSCTRLPDVLRDRLEESWNLHGTRISEYRDCIHHNVPTTFGIETAFMKKLDCGAWSTQLRIPDNPEAKSKRKFVFDGGLDALT
jgi:hypothetical protein